MHVSMGGAWKCMILFYENVMECLSLTCRSSIGATVVCHCGIENLHMRCWEWLWNVERGAERGRAQHVNTHLNRDAWGQIQQSDETRVSITSGGRAITSGGE